MVASYVVAFRRLNGTSVFLSRTPWTSWHEDFRRSATWSDPAAALSHATRITSEVWLHRITIVKLTTEEEALLTASILGAD